MNLLQSPRLKIAVTGAFGHLVRDVVITPEEIQGLREERLYVEAPPRGTTRLTDWVEQNRQTLGRQYTSEMAHRLDRAMAHRPERIPSNQTPTWSTPPRGEGEARLTIRRRPLAQWPGGNDQRSRLKSPP